jgi:hypothetical protein
VTLWLARDAQAATIALPFAAGLLGAVWLHSTVTCTGPAVVPCGYVRVGFAGVTLGFGAVVSIALLAVADFTREVTPSCLAASVATASSAATTSARATSAPRARAAASTAGASGGSSGDRLR